MPESEETDPPADDAGDVRAPVAASADARHFNCRGCGSSLLYKPGSQQITCPYCGAVNDIPGEKEDSDYLSERDFLAALDDEEKRLADGEPATDEAVRCTSCGAVTTLSADRTSERCPYCASPLAVQNHYGVKLNVQAVLPFAVEADRAMGMYREWIGTRWFAPNDFSRRATREKSLDGIYMPYWTYDADTRTAYRGQRGDVYHTTDTYSVMIDGKPQMRTRTVRHIRWTPVSGVVDVAFDDVLVPASRSLPPDLADRLEPWRLGDLKPFRREYLSGFVTETYQTSLRDGFEDAKRRMRPAVNAAVMRDIGGDEQRVASADSRYSGVTFKHILLPVWLSAYAYGGQTYRFMINAQTGEVSGERPWSWIKIALAVVAGAAALGALIYLLYDSGAFDGWESAYFAMSLFAAPGRGWKRFARRAAGLPRAVAARVRRVVVRSA